MPALQSAIEAARTTARPTPPSPPVHPRRPLPGLDNALHDMRRGQSPTITFGPYAGNQLSVDHIIPYAVAPQLDHVIANLELMPLRMNIGKSDRMGERQNTLAKRLRSAELF